MGERGGYAFWVSPNHIHLEVGKGALKLQLHKIHDLLSIEF